MIDHFGLDVVQAYMRHVQDNAEEAVRRSSMPSATATTPTRSTAAP